MVRSPCCSKVGLKRGPWSTQEDTLLTTYIHQHGEGHWRSLPNNAGILRCGKSCRLRWMNYLRPGIKRGNITQDEEDLILRLHSLLGNRWSLIAGRLPGRTDNEIKNYWNTHLLKKLKHAPPPHPNPQQTKPDGKKRKMKIVKSEDEKASPKLIAGHGDAEQMDGVDNTPKAKAYLPRAMRISASVFLRTDSCESLASGEKATEEGWPPLFELGEWDCGVYGYGGGEEDEFFCGEYSPPVTLTVPVLRRLDSICSDDADMLNKVYDEYLQLL